MFIAETIPLFYHRPVKSRVYSCSIISFDLSLNPLLTQACLMTLVVRFAAGNFVAINISPISRFKIAKAIHFRCYDEG